MPLTQLDHVNVRTSGLARMIRFYSDVLGMQEGERPPFNFGGAWLYLEGNPVVHLVEVAEQPGQPSVGKPQIEHFAFRARDLPGVVTGLKNLGVEYRQVTIPTGPAGAEPAGDIPGNIQIFLRDPDGNHIEIQFDASEA